MVMPDAHLCGPGQYDGPIVDPTTRGSAASIKSRPRPHEPPGVVLGTGGPGAYNIQHTISGTEREIGWYDEGIPSALSRVARADDAHAEAARALEQPAPGAYEAPFVAAARAPRHRAAFFGMPPGESFVSRDMGGTPDSIGPGAYKPTYRFKDPHRPAARVKAHPRVAHRDSEAVGPGKYNIDGKAQTKLTHPAGQVSATFSFASIPYQPPTRSDDEKALLRERIARTDAAVAMMLTPDGMRSKAEELRQSYELRDARHAAAVQRRGEAANAAEQRAATLAAKIAVRAEAAAAVKAQVAQQRQEKRQLSMNTQATLNSE